jgi:hypothetical protein
MTGGDVLRMALETALDLDTDREGFETFLFDCKGIARFAKSIAAAEREACAKVCEESNAFDWPECAAAIRARGQA